MHPEVCSRAIKGKPLAYSKKAWNGENERCRLITSMGIALPGNIPDGAGGTAPDGLLDAAATTWTAWRVSTGDAKVLSESNRGCPTSHRWVIWC